PQKVRGVGRHALRRARHRPGEAGVHALDLLRCRFRRDARGEAGVRPRRPAQPREDLPQVTSFALDGLTPRAVERPESAEGVAALLQRAAAERQAVIPWGAGTKQGLGNVPRAYDVALDLAALDQVLEYEPADLV